MSVNHLNFDLTKTFEQSAEEIDIPERTGKIKKIHIVEKLKSIGVNLEDVVLGNFDQIGEVTARKKRDPRSDLYKSKGAFFRPNYERGILIYHLIKEFNLKSFLEIGFGRGYVTSCAAPAMNEMGQGGKVTTVDPALSEEGVNSLAAAFPKDFFSNVNFIQGMSQEYVPTLEEKFDMIYIDGDHRYAAVKSDWENCKDKYNKFLLFDDYHLPGKEQKDIECSSLIDQIEDESKELIIMDRRIFLDDRGYSDEEVNYGQVLLTAPGVTRDGEDKK